MMPKDAIILVVLGPPRKIRSDVIPIVNLGRDSIGLWGSKQYRLAAVIGNSFQDIQIASSDGTDELALY